MNLPSVQVDTNSSFRVPFTTDDIVGVNAQVPNALHGFGRRAAALSFEDCLKCCQLSRILGKGHRAFIKLTGIQNNGRRT
jgi:hypothetical protein